MSIYKDNETLSYEFMRLRFAKETKLIDQNGDQHFAGSVWILHHQFEYLTWLAIHSISIAWQMQRQLEYLTKSNLCTFMNISSVNIPMQWFISAILETLRIFWKFILDLGEHFLQEVLRHPEQRTLVQCTMHHQQKTTLLLNQCIFNMHRLKCKSWF